MSVSADMQFRERLAQVRMMVFDVDGVLTDGSLFIGDDGQEYKAFNSRDGHGMKMLRSTGVEIGIITGRTSKVVNLRMASLGIEHVYQGQLDKTAAMHDLLTKTGLQPGQVVYVGDDVVDIPAMRLAGFSIAVADAHELVRAQADWTTPSRGGRGAARDACELVMSAQGNYDSALAPYLG